MSSSLRTDFLRFTARGFPGSHDHGIAGTKVSEPDLTHALGMVRVCAETEDVIYQGDFSPRHVFYQKGTRPMLETIVAEQAARSPRDQAIQLMGWVYHHIRHAWTSETDCPTDRGLTEEALIASGLAWCNEQVRVFLALCGVSGLPGRLCFVLHETRPFGHAAAEVRIDGRWAFFDPTFDLCVTLPDGTLAEGRELSGLWRPLAHQSYRNAYDRFLPHLSGHWVSHFQHTHDSNPQRPADLLGSLGISNYLPPGIMAADPRYHHTAIPPEQEPPTASNSTTTLL